MAETHNFKEGDVVRLKSGGPLMTVLKVTDLLISCIWFAKNDEKDIQSIDLEPWTLEKYSGIPAA